MQKNQIKQSFDDAHDSYDQVAAVQKQCASDLCAMIDQFCPNLNPNTVLDLGAGTGYISCVLHQKFPNALYSINDISHNMLKSAKHNLVLRDQNLKSKIKLELGDMETIAFDRHSLVASNFALQWIENLEAMIAKIYDTSDDVMLFSYLLDGTFAEWYDLIFVHNSIHSHAKRYANEQEVLDMLRKYDNSQLKYCIKEYPIEFASACDFANYLKKLGASYHCAKDKLDLQSVASIIKQHKKTIHTRYRVLLVLLQKS